MLNYFIFKCFNSIAKVQLKCSWTEWRVVERTTVCCVRYCVYIGQWTVIPKRILVSKLHIHYLCYHSTPRCHVPLSELFLHGGSSVVLYIYI